MDLLSPWARRDEDEDDRPRRRKKKKGVRPIVWIVLAGALLIGGVALYVFVLKAPSVKLRRLVLLGFAGAVAALVLLAAPFSTLAAGGVLGLGLLTPLFYFFIRGFLLPYLERERLRPGVDPAEAADYVSRMLLSFTASPGRWDLTDRAQVAELVRTELVAGILEPAETV